MPKRVNPRVPLGKELGKIRIDLDETLVDMGKRLGVHPSTLRMYECGARLPDQSFFRQIKTVYNVDLTRFYVEPTKSSNNVYGRFLALPIEELEALSAIFKRNSVPTPKIILRAIAEKQGKPMPTKKLGRPAGGGASASKKKLPPVSLKPVAPAAPKEPDVDGVDFVGDDELDGLEEIADLDE